MSQYQGKGEPKGHSQVQDWANVRLRIWIRFSTWVDLGHEGQGHNRVQLRFSQGNSQRKGEGQNTWSESVLWCKRGTGWGSNSDEKPGPGSDWVWGSVWEWRSEGSGWGSKTGSGWGLSSGYQGESQGLNDNFRIVESKNRVMVRVKSRVRSVWGTGSGWWLSFKVKVVRVWMRHIICQSEHQRYQLGWVRVTVRVETVLGWSLDSSFWLRVRVT